MPPAAWSVPLIGFWCSFHQSIGVAGHLFIVRGDLTKLACDAWLLPTGFKLKVEDYWLQPEPLGFSEAVRALANTLSPDWKSGTLRVLPAPVWDDSRSRPWLVNIVQQTFDEMAGTVRQFVSRVLAEQRAPINGRQRHLLALPVISTGLGGGAKVKGRVINALVKALSELVREFPVDLVLVTHTAAAMAAAQKARFESNECWSELSSDLMDKAKELAQVSGQQGLALFLGAGVSCSAGLPSWTGLLDQLARDIGISEYDLEEFERLDVLDRGSVLERRFRARGLDINQSIAEIFSRSWDHSLLHGLLACLPAAEVITQNYDRLYEVAAMGAGMPVAALPYTPGDVHSRWLLKMHGCVSVPEDIVIRREDYLRYSERRAALAGIVQATLLTRKMLFVGFSLRDGNFHRAVDDVRRAVVHKEGKRLGTALFLAPSALTAELWQTELDIVHFQSGDSQPSSTATSARRLEIFLDCVLAHCGTNTGHLLDPTFDHLLSSDERALKLELLKLTETVTDSSKGTPAWQRVQKLLESMGWES